MQFLLFQQSFQETCMAATYKPELVRERVKDGTRILNTHMYITANLNLLPKKKMLAQEIGISNAGLKLQCNFSFSSNVFMSLLRQRYLTHSHTMTPSATPGKQTFWQHCGKRRNCSLRAISPFPTVFSTRLDNFLPFSSNLKLSSANSFSLEASKICRLVMG